MTKPKPQKETFIDAIKKGYPKSPNAIALGAAILKDKPIGETNRSHRNTRTNAQFIWCIKVLKNKSQQDVNAPQKYY